MKALKDILPYFIAAMVFMATYPLYAKSTDLALPVHRAVPITVWIVCDGEPVAIVSTASNGYFFGDALDAYKYQKEDPVFVGAVMEESYKINTHFRINLSASKVVECRVK